MRTPDCKSRVIVATALIIATCEVCAADPGRLAVRTASGCQVMVSSQDEAKRTELGMKAPLREWSGPCVAGFATGLGVYREQWEDIDDRRTTHMLEGESFGYFVMQRTWRPNAEIDNGFTRYGFRLDGRIASFSMLGLDGDKNLVKNMTGQMPWRYSGELVPRQSVIGDSATGNLNLVADLCSMRQPVPAGCSLNSPFDVFVFKGRSGSGSFGEVAVCPNPRDVRSCKSTAEQLAAPYVRSIEQFIGQSQAEVQARMSRVSALLGHAQGQAAERVQADASLLARLPAGELFALADERRSSGDPAGARAALTAFLNRFPGHSLAPAASRVLAELSGAGK